MLFRSGLPARILRVEDVGRHKIVRAETSGREINVVVGEDASIGADATGLVFDPAGVNVYADDWLVAPSGRRIGEAA